MDRFLIEHRCICGMREARISPYYPFCNRGRKEGKCNCSCSNECFLSEAHLVTDTRPLISLAKADLVGADLAGTDLTGAELLVIGVGQVQLLPDERVKP